ncbi:uncharacterized protein [Nothobranchius furzeri]|nr:uncharacterized protein LOC129157097 isoform X1 [Nothobranchius furzeri]
MSVTDIDVHFCFRMPKRKYKLYLEPNSTIKLPSARWNRETLDTSPLSSESCDQVTSGPYSADFETTSSSGHFDFPEYPDDTINLTLPYTECGREDAADVETMSPCGCLESDSDETFNLPTTSSGGLSVLQSSDVSQEFECDSSSESDPQVDSNIEDLPEDDPFGQIGFDTDMDSALISGGTTTRAEALLMVMSHAARHNITGTQLDDLLKLINALFGKEVLPRSKYLFNKVFKNSSDIVEFHFYCKTCKLYIGKQEDIKEKNIVQCTICSAPIEISTLNSASFFISIPIAPQIQTLMENPQIQNSMNYRYQRQQNEHVISDIYDGEMYQNLSKPGGILSDPANLSFNFNSDGSPVYKSSKFSIWPIQLHLNELPPKLRFQNVMLAGLWFGAQEPVMPIFLKLFVDQAKTLASKGVSWRKCGALVNSKIVGLCCCVDSKARPAMQNTTQFNGYFGCGFCLHPGTLVEKQVKYTVTATEYPEREANKMIADMEQAVEQHRSVRGVKGPSPLINMPYFDIVWGFVPDYMHAVLLGVIRQLTELLLSGSDQPYYIGSPNTMRVLENRIKEIKPPHLITRLPRPIAEFKYWKASEWRAWLLFYSLPVLNGVLQSRYVKHLSLLVFAVFLLLKENVTFEEINKADEMLFEFVARFQLLYGEASMTFNVHLLTHLSKSVKLWGPLWAHSAFVFENANGGLLKLFHGTKCVALQIVNKFLLHRTVPLFSTRFAVSEQVKNFCLELTNNSRVKSFIRYQDTTVLDNGRVTETTEEEKSAFISAEKVPPDEMVVHKRMVHKGLVYTSKSYSLSKRRRDCYGKLSDGVCGEIRSIISFPSECGTEIAVLFQKFHTQASFPLPQGYRFESHIRLISRGPTVDLIPVDRLEQKCLVLKTGDETYICDFPNQHERD